MGVRLFFLIAVALSLLVWERAARAQEGEDFSRFQLWNACRPMRLAVEGLSPDAATIGLTAQSVEDSARLRLQMARLYDAGAEASAPYLYVRVSVVGGAFSVRAQYVKVLHDPVSKSPGMVASWDDSSTGTHGGDAGYIRFFVSAHTDKFIDEYVRVNAESCQRG